MFLSFSKYVISVRKGGKIDRIQFLKEEPLSKSQKEFYKIQKNIFIEGKNIYYYYYDFPRTPFIFICKMKKLISKFVIIGPSSMDNRVGIRESRDVLLLKNKFKNAKTILETTRLLENIFQVNCHENFFEKFKRYFKNFLSNFFNKKNY